MNRRTAPIALLVAGLILLGGCASRPQVRLQDHWSVDLSQARQQLEELSESHGSVPLAYTLANLAAVYDAELLLLFREQLDATCPQVQPRHVEDQIAWLAARKRKMRAAADELAGGSLAPVAAARVSIEETRKRIEELERRPLPGC